MFDNFVILWHLCIHRLLMWKYSQSHYLTSEFCFIEQGKKCLTYGVICYGCYIFMKCISNSVLVTITYDSRASKLDKLLTGTGVMVVKVQPFLLLNYVDIVWLWEFWGMSQLPNVSFPRSDLVQICILQIFLHLQL